MNEQQIMSLFSGWHALYRQDASVFPKFRAYIAHSLDNRISVVVRKIEDDGTENMFDAITEHCDNIDDAREIKEYWKELLDEPVDMRLWSRMVMTAKRDHLAYIEENIAREQDEADSLRDDIRRNELDDINA
jgi:hypothetical protein